jgi:transposase-like protein
MSSTSADVRRGRPVKGSALVDGLEGSAGAKLRLRLVIDSLSGKIAVEEACRQLGIGESRFHAMRQEALAGALSGLEPSPAGRPAKPRPEDDPEREKLREELLQAKMELQAARVREEIAIAMPNVLQSRKNELLKKTPPRPGRGPGPKGGT